MYYYFSITLLSHLSSIIDCSTLRIENFSYGGWEWDRIKISFCLTRRRCENPNILRRKMFTAEVAEGDNDRIVVYRAANCSRAQTIRGVAWRSKKNLVFFFQIVSYI
jgi:hypothetical protein